MIQDLNATVMATKAEIDELNKKLIDEEEGRKALESNSEAAVKIEKERAEIFEKKCIQIGEELVAIREKKESLENAMAEEREEKAVLLQTISSLQKEREERLIEMTATEEEHRRQIEAHAQLESAANEQESVRLKDLTAELSVAISNLDIMRNETEMKMTSMTEKHDIVIAELRAAHESQMAENAQKMIEMKDKVKAKMSEIRDQNNNRIAELSSEIDRLHAVDKDSAEKITNLEALLATETELASTRSQEMSVEVDALRAENLTLQQNITHLISTSKCDTEVQSSVDEKSIVGGSVSGVRGIDKEGEINTVSISDMAGDVMKEKGEPLTSDFIEGDVEEDTVKTVSEQREERTGGDMSDKGKGRDREKGGKKKGGKGNKGEVNMYVAPKDVEKNIKEDQLQSLVSKLEEDLKCSRDQMALLQSQLDAHGDQAEAAAALRSLVLDKDKKVSHLIEDKEKATSESERDSQVALQYETSLKNLQEQFDTMKMRLESDIASNADSLEQRAIQLKEKDDEILGIREACDAEVRSAHEKTQAETEAVEVLRHERDSLAERVTHLDEKLIKCYSDLDLMNDEKKASLKIDTLVAVKDVEKNVKEDQLQSLVSKLEEDLKCSRDQMALLQSQLDAHGDQAEAAAALRSLVLDKDKKVSHLIEDKEKATSESERDSQVALQYETSLKNLQEQFDTMKMRLESDIASNADSLEQRAIQLKEKDVEILGIREACEAEVRSAHEKTEAETQAVEVLRQERDSLAERVSHLDEQLTKCYSDSDQMKDEMKASLEGEDARKRDADLHEQHLQDLKSELAALQGAYVVEQADRRNADATIESISTTAAAEADRRDAAERELKAALAEKDKVLEEREQEIQRAAKCAHDLQVLVEQKQSDVLRLEDLLHAEEARVKAHVETISALKDAALLAATETEQLRVI